MALSEHETGEGRTAGRDPLLERAYAGIAREEPPASLDDAIRAAARREAGSRPRSLRTAFRAWRMPVSLAAVVVLSVSVVLLMREQGADRPDAGRVASAPELPAERAGERAKQEVEARRDAAEPRKQAPASEHLSRQGAQAPERAPRERPADGPAPASAPALSANTQASADKVQAPSEPGPPQAQAERRMREARPFPDAKEEVASADRPASQPGVSARTAEADAMTGSAEARASGAVAENKARSEAIPPPPPAKPAARSPVPSVGALAARESVWAGFEKLPAERWIERIEELRRAGRTADAREMLEEFKRRFPEYPLPANLAP